ncbi:phage tail protein, partial [Pectobacterium brasiliense]
MANLSENPQWVDGIYQIETSDPVAGGPDGVSNRQAKELASRTSYLKKEQEKTGSDLATHAAASDPHTQYAPKASPTFTGTPKAPTPATDSNSQQVATTAFVRSAGATKLAKDQNGADIQDRELFNRNLGSSRAYSSSIPIGGGAGLWTTAEFIGWLESQGAFVHAYWV